MVDRVRMMYASGCYSKYELWESVKYMYGPGQLEEILYAPSEYLPAILELDQNILLYSNYQKELRAEVDHTDYMEKRGKTHPYEERKRQLDEIYLSQMTLPVNMVKRVCLL